MNMRTILLLIIGCLLVFSLFNTVSAKTIYVDDDGTADYDNIKLAIATSDDGDTIYVHSGIYLGFISVYKRVNLIGEDKNTTIIDGGGEDWGELLEITVDGVNISGFTFRSNQHSYYQDYPGIVVKSNNNLINDNIFWGIIESKAINLVGASDNIISNNTIFGNNWGIYLDNSSNNNNIFLNSLSDSTLYGICIYSSDYNTVNQNTISDIASGVHLGGANNTIISGNIISDAANHGIDLSVSSDFISSYNNKIFNNTVSNCKFNGIFLYNASNNEVNDNFLVNNEGNGIGLSRGSHNTITENSISENSQSGIFIIGSSYNIITENIIENNNVGIWIEAGSDTSIIPNPENNEISDNIFSGNSEDIKDETIDFDNESQTPGFELIIIICTIVILILFLKRK